MDSCIDGQVGRERLTSDLNAAMEAYMEPVHFWHELQWQRLVRDGGSPPLMRIWMAPQRQEPVRSDESDCCRAIVSFYL